MNFNVWFIVFCVLVGLSIVINLLAFIAEKVYKKKMMKNSLNKDE